MFVTQFTTRCHNSFDESQYDQSHCECQIWQLNNVNKLVDSAGFCLWYNLLDFILHEKC